MKQTLFAITLVFLFGGTSFGYDIPIDNFDEAVNTAALISVGGVPDTATDDPVGGVLGGARTVLAETLGGVPVLCQTDIFSGLFNYMSLFDAAATITYDGGGAGLGRAVACAESIEISYQDADAPAQGVGTPVLAIGVALDGELVSQDVDSEAGTLSFPLSDYPGADLENLGMIEVIIANTETSSADIVITDITAVDCEAPEVPSPAMGAGPLALGTIVLAGLGLLGVARRRTL